MKKVLFKGSGVALITPFKEDMSVNFESLDSLVDYHLQNSTDALIVIGTTGEASTMIKDEKIKVVDFVIKKVAGKIPVIVGAGSNNTVQAVEMSKEYEKLGADGLLIVTPYYNKGNQDGIYKHYLEISNSVNIPIILYNVPGRTGVNLSIDMIKKLAKEENIVAIKEASGDISYATEIARAIPEIAIYSGNDDINVPILSIGGVGTISVLANTHPKAVHDMITLYLNGEVEKARKLQLKYNGYVKELFSEVNPVPVKKALELIGMRVGGCRLPLGEMQSENIERLKMALKEVGEL